MSIEKVNELPIVSSESMQVVEPPSAPRTWRVWLAAAVIGISIGYFGAMLAQKYMAELNQIDAEIAPGFILESLLSEGTISLSDYKGKAVVLNFWASWCFPCKIEMPALQQAWENNQAEDIIFIGVNVWDDKADAIAFLSEFGVTYPNGFDPTEMVDDNYALLGVPTTWFIYPDGRVAHKVMGPLDLDLLDAAIALILGKDSALKE